MENSLVVLHLIAKALTYTLDPCSPRAVIAGGEPVLSQTSVTSVVLLIEVFQYAKVIIYCAVIRVCE
jgi:hypothetical protein